MQYNISIWCCVCLILINFSILSKAMKVFNFIFTLGRAKEQAPLKCSTCVAFYRLVQEKEMPQEK